MSQASKEDDSCSPSPDTGQLARTESDSQDAQRFRPMMEPVEPVQPSGNRPDSTDSTPTENTAKDTPKPSFGGGFKMPIFKGPIRKISKTKSSKSELQKADADSKASHHLEKNSESNSDENKSKKKSVRSPAEKLSTPAPPYREPSWSGIPEDEYYLEVLKGGAICAKIGLNDHPFHLFGRLETNHVQLDHPSLSRYHAVLQFRAVGDNEHDPGFYLFDLGSTHGTTLNKKQIEPNVYCRVQVGHMFKLAGSTRLYILQGGNAAVEEEGRELSIEQLKEMQVKRMEEKELLRMKNMEKKEEEIEDDSSTGISWGMAEDADAESDLTHNPYALDADDDKEAPYLKDPKKALRGFFEREGDELEYKVDEMGIGRSHQYICKVVLPLDDNTGTPIVAEAAVSGKKKEAVLACALEACKILDRHGVLRQAKHESKKRKDKNWAADDYYDSDEDTFLDRTGEIEKKRIKRMRKAGAEKQETLTYDKLLVQLQELEKEIQKAESDLATMNDGDIKGMAEDSLDAFMDSIKSGFKDRNQRAKLKLRLVDLRKEQLKLKKLINIAKPAKMPELKPSSKPEVNSSGTTKPKMQAMIGKMHGSKKFRFAPLVKKSAVVAAKPQPEEEEEEEDEQDIDNRMDVTEPDSKPEDNKNNFDSSVVEEEKPVYSESIKSSSVTDQQPLLPKGPSLPPIKVQSSNPSSVSKGPTLPPNFKYCEEVDNDEDEDETQTKYDKLKNKKEKRKSNELPKHVAEDEDIHDWVPPEGQTGDGRTSLNAKFGY